MTGDAVSSRTVTECLLILLLIPGGLSITPSQEKVTNSSSMDLWFPWNNQAIPVAFSMGYPTFVYTSAYPEARITGLSQPFVYYGEGLSYLPGDIVILDPPSPGGENSTFLDIYYNQTTRTRFEQCLCRIIENLTLIGVRGIVLGDEWPRGLNNQEITIQLLSRHNTTYHQETGAWMHPEPSQGEKEALADWFYDRSIQAWNTIAWLVRSRFPDLYLGTNTDLVWEPDFNRLDIAHWKTTDWRGKVDLGPYDFVVTHYFTRIHTDSPEDMQNPMLTDEANIARLDTGLEHLLNPSKNLTQGMDVILLLGAHCQHPYIITPMQMVQEWNTAMKYKDLLVAVGWFTFDLWTYDGSILSRSITGFSPAPMCTQRLITLNFLANQKKLSVPKISWERAPGSVSVDHVVGITPSNDGGVIVTGNRHRHLSGQESSSIFLMKIGVNGDMVWNKTYRDGTAQSVECLVESGDGGFVLGGSQEQVTWERIENEIFVAKLDCDGSKIWETQTPGVYTSCLIKTRDNGFLVAGHKDWENIFVLRLNPNGSKIREIIHRGEWDPICATELEDGRFVLGGASHILLIDVDSSSRQICEKRYETIWYAGAITETVSGGFTIAGVVELGPYWYERVIMGFDDEGTALWNKTLDLQAEVIGVEGGFIFSNNNDIAKIDYEGNLIWEIDLGNIWDVGSNPYFSDRCIVELENNDLVSAASIAGDLRILRLNPSGEVIQDQVIGDADQLNSVARDRDGYVSVGWTQASGPSPRNGYLLKVDQEGNDVWERVYGTVGWDELASLYPCRDGFIAVGRTKTSCSDDYDTYLISFKPDGELLWEIILGLESQDDWAESITETPDSEYVIAGAVSHDVGSDIRLISINGLGEVLWEKTYSQNDSIHVSDITTTLDQNFVVVGWTSSHEWDQDTDAFFLKIDGNGELIWEQTIDYDERDVVYCVLADGDGGCIAGGSRQNAYLLKLDRDGNVLWERDYEGPGQSVVGIAETEYGDHLAIGEWSGLPIGFGGDQDLYLLRVDEKGNKIWEKGFGNHPTSITGTGKKYVITGYADGPRAYLAGIEVTIPEGFTNLLSLMMVLPIITCWIRGKHSGLFQLVRGPRLILMLRKYRNQKFVVEPRLNAQCVYIIGILKKKGKGPL